MADMPLERMCRACMTESSAAMMPLWPSTIDGYDIVGVSSISTMFTSFTVFGASAGDGLPENICLSCVAEMNQAYSFKQKCERSELALRSFQGKSVRVDGSGTSNCRLMTNFVSVESDEPIKSKSPHGHGKRIKKVSYLVQERFANDDDDDDDDGEDISERKPVYQCINCPKKFESTTEIERHALEGNCTNCKRDSSNNFDFDDGSPDLRADSDDNDEDDDHDNDDHNPIDEEKLFSIPLNDVPAALVQPEKKSLFVCENCNRSFIQAHQLNVHRDSKKCIDQIFECDICKHVFSTKRNIRRHIHRQHRIEKRRRKNAKDPNPQKKYKCELCPKAFYTPSSYRDHQRTHSGERPFLCSFCGKGFGQSANLRQHMMRHSKMKPYQCNHCPKTFVSKGELNSHQRSHDGAHPFVCDVCGTGFTTSSSMTKHRRIHTGERRYACEYCPLRFTALSTLKNHTRIHTGEKPYQCQFCSRAFGQRSDCVSHERIHTGERPYRCELCDAHFYKSCMLRTHMKKEHNITLETKQRPEQENL